MTTPDLTPPAPESRLPPLMIVGASARAAAQSARRAGYLPLSIDLFADLDCQRAGRAVRVSDLQQACAAAAKMGDAVGWMFTGGMENRPGLLRRLSGLSPCLGAGLNAVEKVRNPPALMRLLREADLPAPEALLKPPSTRAGRWLQKPLRGAGGVRVATWSGVAGARRARGGEYYFQQFIEGQAQAAVFLAAAGGVRLLGVTRQLVGAKGHPSPFLYAGSIGPIIPPPERQARLQRMGETIAATGMIGLFGVDLIDDGRAYWPVETNPRYVASAEILERAVGASAVGAHVAACRGETPDWPAATDRRVFGKRIVYTPRRMSIPGSFCDWALQQCNADWPRVADIPTAGEAIEQFHPIVTVFAEGRSDAEVEGELDVRAADVLRLLDGA